MDQRFRPASLVPGGLIVDGVAIESDLVLVRGCSSTAACRCPDCGAISRRIQSRYFRRAKELPLSGRRVELQVLVRRFRCDGVLCGRQIFAERFDYRCPGGALTPDRAPRPYRPAPRPCLGRQARGEPCCRMMLPVSNDTLLRVVRRRAKTPSEPLRVIGIDDFAWRRNHRYGTIVCDLERRRPVVLLPDREPATSVAWLRHEPAVHTVARDRGGGYGEAVARALPEAMQVADRWHLMENASRAFLDAVRKSMRQVRRTIGATVVNPALLTAAEKLQYEGYLRREETNTAVLALWQAGVPIKQIVRRTGHHRMTVRRIARGERGDVFRPRQSSLEAHLPWLDAQWEPAPATHRPSGARCERAASKEAFGSSWNGRHAAAAPREPMRAALPAFRRRAPSRGW